MTLTRLRMDCEAAEAEMRELRSGVVLILAFNPELPSTGGANLLPKLEKLAVQWRHVHFFCFDTIRRDDLVDALQMRATPSVLIMRDGRPVDPPLGRFNRFPAGKEESMFDAIRHALSIETDRTRNVTRQQLADPSLTAMPASL